MFFAHRPSDARVRERLAPLAQAAFTHGIEGLTRGPIQQPPGRFRLDVFRCELGHGEAVYARAVEGLRSFSNYPATFTRVVRLSPGFGVGTVFGTVASHFGFASMQPCRIAFLIDEPEEKRFGYGLGTLPGHVLSGEECFVVWLDEGSESVQYEIRVLSRPATFSARVGRPLTRRVQRRFRQESHAAMRAHCKAADQAIESDDTP